MVAIVLTLAALFLGAQEDYRVWFDGGTPKWRQDGYRLFLQVRTNRPAAVICTVENTGPPDVSINCPPGTLVSIAPIACPNPTAVTVRADAWDGAAPGLGTKVATTRVQIVCPVPMTTPEVQTATAARGTHSVHGTGTKLWVPLDNQPTWTHTPTPNHTQQTQTAGPPATAAAQTAQATANIRASHTCENFIESSAHKFRCTLSLTNTHLAVAESRWQGTIAGAAINTKITGAVFTHTIQASQCGGAFLVSAYAFLPDGTNIAGSSVNHTMLCPILTDTPTPTLSTAQKTATKASEGTLTQVAGETATATQSIGASVTCGLSSAGAAHTVSCTLSMINTHVVPTQSNWHESNIFGSQTISGLTISGDASPHCGTTISGSASVNLGGGHGVTANFSFFINCQATSTWTPIPTATATPVGASPQPPRPDSGGSGNEGGGGGGGRGRRADRPPPTPTRDSRNMPVPTQDHSKLPENADVQSDTPWIQFREVTGAAIGVPSVLDRGARSAIDVWGPLGVDAEVCFDDIGSVILLDAAYSPRLETPLFSVLREGQTCVHVDRPGTVVLMPGEPSLMVHAATATPPVLQATASGNDALTPDDPNAMVPLANCHIGSYYVLNLRATPAGEILAWYYGDQVRVLGRTPNWFKIEYNGTTGWVTSHYAIVTGDCG